VARLTAHGFTLDVPAGWDARIYRRPAADEVGAASADGPPAPPGATTHAVVHAATIPMPPDIGDFGSSGVDHLGPNDAFVVVFDHGPAAVGQSLFAREGMPRLLEPGDLDPNVLQRTLPGQSGMQAFFTESGRACCLYVVLGSHSNSRRVVPRVNQVLADLQIEAEVGALTAPIPPPTVVDAITSDPEVSGFARLLTEAEPAVRDALTGPGPVTVFAPTNAALAQATNLAAIERDAARLTRVVRFHIVADVVDIGQLAAQQATASPTTIEGHAVTVTTGQHEAYVQGVLVDPRRIVAGNGSVYTIAALLEPPA
jgi:uncharacterized surface protein with fasciclin (FAS1) repeats